MINLEENPFPEKALSLDDNAQGRVLVDSFSSPYMRTDEAVAYMGVSKSYLLRQQDIPYHRGKPNIYKRADLDAAMERRIKLPEEHE